MIEIHKYCTEDAFDILKIINFNILNTVSIYDYEIRTLENQISIFDDKIKKNYPVIVAKYNNKIVGFGMYSEFRFKVAYQFTVEHSVYVDHRFHEMGIGKLLLSELIEIAKKQNRHSMIAVIDSENKNSIALHSKFGFDKVGVLKDCGFKFNRWIDTVFMQIILK